MLAMATEQNVSADRSFHRARLRAVVLLVVWTISLGYMASRLKVGWVPHDEGTLGLSAERVLQGQLPHRDFDDYTGGLTFVHALAFRIFGVSLAPMRYVLFAFFVPWVPAVFYIASRTGSAISAGVVTLLAVAWSVPNYPGPMPSWYNLFFATWGVAALFRYLDTGSPRWLLAAGLCGGLSMLAKIAAAYYVAGVLLFFVFREQSIAVEQRDNACGRAWFYSTTVTMGLAVFVVLLFRMIQPVAGLGGFFLFVLPAMLLAGLLIAREVDGGSGSEIRRFKTLFGMCMPFAAGMAAPLVVFLIAYAVAGAASDLIHGIFAVPARAMRFAASSPLSPLETLTVIPFLLPVLLAHDSRGRARTICGAVLALLGGAVLAFSIDNSIIFGIGWGSVAYAMPVLVAAGVAILWVWRESTKLGVLQQQRVVLLMCVAALCSVIQFPLATKGYFVYAAPLVILGAAALLLSVPDPPKLALGALCAFYLLFGLFSVTRYRLGLQREPHVVLERLTVARAGGLRVEASDSKTYRQVVSLIQSHAAGKFIYAAPDCPEVYFLSGLASPSRHYFGFAEAHADRTNWVLERLESLGVTVVAIKKDPRFSNSLAKDLQNDLEKRYPLSEDIADFTVRWKEQR